AGALVKMRLEKGGGEHPQKGFEVGVGPESLERALQIAIAARAQGAEQVLEHAAVEPELAAEVVVDRRQIAPGERRDGADRGVAVAPAGEQDFGRLEEAFPRAH